MVLRGFDKGLEFFAWWLAGVLGLMLFIGPVVVAEDKPPSAAEAGPGQAIFRETCGSCHTLSRADTSGNVGPNLDNVGLQPADIEAIVRSGRGAMPSFEGQLSDQEIKDVATFVAGPNYSSSGR